MVGEAIVRIRQDDTGFDPAKAGSSAGEGYTRAFSGKLKGLAVTIAGVLAVGKAVELGKTAVDRASDLNETVSKTKVVFGSAADSVLAFSDKGAAALGQTKQQVLDAASTFGIFGKAAGLSGNDLADFSNKFTGLATDLASFHNTSPQEAIEAISAALRGESEPIRKYGVLLDDASLRQEALREGLVKTTKDALTPQQRTLAASALIMKQTTIAQGDFQRTSGGLANQQRILSATLTDMSTKLGTYLLPAVVVVVKALNAGLQPAFDATVRAANRISSVVTPVFHDLSEAAKVGFAIFNNQAAVSDSNSPLVRIGAQAGMMAKTVQGVLTGTVIPAVQAALPVIGQLAVYLGGLASQVIAQLVPVFHTASATFTTSVLPALQQLAGFIMVNVVPVIRDLARIFVTEVVPVVVQVATFIYGTLYPALIAIAQQVGERLAPVFVTLFGVVRRQILPTLERVANQVRTQLIPALEPLILKIVTVVGFFARLAATILSVVLPPLLRLAGFLIARVVPAVVSIITVVVKVISTILSWGIAIGRALGFLGRLGGGLRDLVSGALTAVFNAVADLPGRIIGLGGKLFSAGKTIIGKLISGLKGAGGLVSDIAGNVWGAVKGLINSAIDHINSALEFTISLPGPDIHINPPNIGHLQGGTSSAAGGYYNVGEVGPERVYLPRGARVLTTAQTRQEDARTGIDYDRLATVLADALRGARPVQFQLPHGVDPEAAAMAVLNRLVTV